MNKKLAGLIAVIALLALAAAIYSLTLRAPDLSSPPNQISFPDGK